MAIMAVAASVPVAAGQQASTITSANFRQVQQAASRGDARAQYDLGTYYARTDVPEHNDALALQWLQKSAEQGLADAQHALGMMYLEARGTKQDYVQAE